MARTFSKLHSQRGTARFVKVCQFCEPRESHAANKMALNLHMSEMAMISFFHINKAHLYLPSLLLPLRFKFVVADSKSVGGLQRKCERHQYNGCAGLSSKVHWHVADTSTEILVDRDVSTFTQLISLQEE